MKMLGHCGVYPKREAGFSGNKKDCLNNGKMSGPSEKIGS